MNSKTIKTGKMQKPFLILFVLALISGSYTQATKNQPQTTNDISIEHFVGKWQVEYFLDVEDRTLSDSVIDYTVVLYRLELNFEKDTTVENTLIGWHCALIREGRQIDCSGKEWGDEPFRGYLKNDTVYVHFINNWDDEVKAKLYFDQSEQNLLQLIWQLDKYEPKLRSFFNEKDTLKKI